MEKRPLVWLTLIFCSGIAFAGLIKIPFLLVYLPAAALFIPAALSRKANLAADIFLACLVFLSGASFLKASRVLAANHISKHISYQNKDSLYTVKGFVLSQPLEKGSRLSFRFKTETVSFNNLEQACSGDILVYLQGARGIGYGEELILRGRLSRPFGRLRAASQSYRAYLYNQGIYAVMYVKASACRPGVNKNKGSPLKRLALRAKDRLGEIISAYTSLPASAVLEAMILGEKKKIPPLLNDAMVKSGTVHILVVSGFNVTIVASIIVLLLKLIRVPRRLRFCIAIPLLIFYCLLTGASNPVVRATVMAIVFLSAFLFKCQADIYNSCAIAALFILGINPNQLFDIGFQLSFASVIAIVYLYPRLRSLLRLNSLGINWLRLLVEGCLVSLSAWLGTMGFIAYYFKVFSPVTVLANIFIVPLATLITLCGFSLVAAGLVLPGLAALPAACAQFLVMLLLRINSALLELPFAYFYL